MARNIKSSGDHSYSGISSLGNGGQLVAPFVEEGPTMLNCVLQANSYAGAAIGRIGIDTSRLVPTGLANKPRALGLLPCIYTG